MEKVKKLVEAGAAVPSALKEALGRPVSAIARDHGLVREELSGVINLRVVPDAPILRALAIELQTTPEEVLAFWWDAARREVAGPAEEDAALARPA